MGDNNAFDLDSLVKLEGEARRAVRALGLKVEMKSEVKSRQGMLGPLRDRLPREDAA